ncbi:MAG: acetolactate synthase, large subunit, biosynthetic type [Gammaproteobacteria bacterium]|nr:acetolactate synthase, large subunit, biosynthetic type [Gammaproteobacteria bacterium]|tara:strand:+ start:4715 stop:6526 length:1812 start_codon:yes stop_codon:yes gene_type:complete
MATSTKIEGSSLIVRVLAEQGVEIIFGYSGGAILPTYDAVFRYNSDNKINGKDPMPLIVPANEQGAGFMAAGYARATGKPGVVLVTSGPGATNTVTPVRDAMADSIPMVVICGQVARASIGTDAFQEAPITSIMGSVAKHVFLVTEPEKLEATMRAAFEIAASGRPGPVVVDIPKDIQNSMITPNKEARLNITAYRERLNEIHDRELNDLECKEFFEYLDQSERPLLYVGGGVIAGEGSKSLRDFAKKFQIPIATTLMGIGAIGTQSILSLRMLGMHGTAYANYAVEDCDFVITVGARFDDRVAAIPKKFAPKAKAIAHFDIDPSEIDKVKNVNWFHIGILNKAINKLSDYADEKNLVFNFANWLDVIQELKSNHALSYNRESNLIQPQMVLEEINKLTKGKAIVTTGVGQHQMWAAQYFDFDEPRQWLTSGSMGTMGFGLPAAIGAQFAKPDLMVIDVDGDGSIRMNLGELETVTAYELPVKILLLNNAGDGMVKQWQKLYYDARFSGSDKTLRQKDFVMSAKSDGFEYAERLSKKKDVARTIKKFIDFPKAAFLEVIIDPDAMVYPMVGPGMAYDQMVTGEFISSRESDQEIDDIDPNAMF